ncbi:MAG: HNH endonuclease [Betaproteobacteria bacterium]|nr:HNH endonuclease [Betaproteobacteria bacterium]
MTKFFAEVFHRDNHRCVYCGRDMMTDFDTFWTTEEDHLIPSSRCGMSDSDNIVTACSVCNRMKGNFTPAMSYSRDIREAYIHAIREHIMAQRAKHMRDFASWTHPASASLIRAPGD